MNNRTFVLSTVGTSLLGHMLTKEERSQDWRFKLIDTANQKKDEMDPVVYDKIVELAQRAKDKLLEDDPDENRRISAELNGIYGFYDNQLAQGKTDHHFLVCTDTVQGQLCGEVVQFYLRKKGMIAEIYSPKKLSTIDTQNFSIAIKDLIKWCEEVIPPFKEQGYDVCFNLVGGFKSLQGYLNTIGMFYADKILYIFESGNTPIIIPRLPIEIDTNVLTDYSIQLAMMAHGYLCPVNLLENLPEALFDTDNKDALLSNWGQLVWDSAKNELLSNDLLAFPRLTYEVSFQRDFGKLPKNDRVKLQEILAKIAMLLEDNNGDSSILKRDGGLQYDNYTNKKFKGHPIGHFRINSGNRVSCIAESGILKLRHCGEHDYVNNNP